MEPTTTVLRSVSTTLFTSTSCYHVTAPLYAVWFRDVVKCHRSYQMEELQHLLLGLALPILFWPHTTKKNEVIQMLPDPYLWAAWGHLVQIAVFNLTEQCYSSQEDLETEARDLREQHIPPLAKLIEQVGTVWLFLVFEVAARALNSTPGFRIFQPTYLFSYTDLFITGCTCGA